MVEVLIDDEVLFDDVGMMTQLPQIIFVQESHINDD